MGLNDGEGMAGVGHLKLFVRISINVSVFL